MENYVKRHWWQNHSWLISNDLRFFGTIFTWLVCEKCFQFLLRTQDTTVPTSSEGQTFRSTSEKLSQLQLCTYQLKNKCSASKRSPWFSRNLHSTVCDVILCSKRALLQSYLSPESELQCHPGLPEAIVKHGKPCRVLWLVARLNVGPRKTQVVENNSTTEFYADTKVQTFLVRRFTDNDRTEQVDTEQHHSAQ